MKMKTLKDLRGTIGKPFGVLGDGKIQFGFREDDLKAEAVKWVKYIKKNFGNVNPFKAEDFIYDFFNLTSEDLK